MKRLYKIVLFVFAVITTWACEKEVEKTSFSKQEGAISVLLKTKSVEFDIHSFFVEIFNKSDIRILRKKYESISSTPIKLNAGEFRLVATYGDSLGIGFDRPYYRAEQNFEVHCLRDNNGEPDHVKAVARLANVGLKVNFSSNIKGSYEDYYVIAHRLLSAETRAEGANAVKFVKGETRTAYMPAGKIYLEIFAKARGAEEYGYYKTEPVEYSSSDVVTFNVDAEKISSELKLAITIDNSVTLIEKEEIIPASALPSSGIDFWRDGKSSNSFKTFVKTGTHQPNVDERISINSKEGVKSIFLQLKPASVLNETIFSSSDVQTSSTDAKADFAAVSNESEIAQASEILKKTDFVTEQGLDLKSCSEEVKGALKSLGIDWELFDNCGYIDVSSLCAEMSVVKNLKPSALSSSTDSKEIASLVIRAVDEQGKQTEASVDFCRGKNTSSLSADENNFWATSIKGVKLSFSDVETLDKYVSMGLQYSEDGILWKNVDIEAIKGNTILYKDIESLQPETEYSLRIVPVGDESCASEPISFMTEKRVQLKNAGFEKFRKNVFETKASLWFSTVIYKVDWWQFDEEGAKWAVNSPVTLNSSCKKEYPDYKSFPLVSVCQGGNSGDYSALIASIAIDDWASEVLSGNAHTGELFLGETNVPEGADQKVKPAWNESGWKKVENAISFKSRPSAMKFMYKLDSHEQEPFFAGIYLYDVDGNIIGEGKEESINENVTDWTECIVPIRYTVKDVKAASIGVSIRSSATDSKNSRSILIKTLSGEHTVHAGNLLYIDDIVLEYY